jgi:hypothetical protein
MTTATFTFDGIQGRVTQDGFMQWATMSCWLDSLKESPLKSAAQAAIDAKQSEQGITEWIQQRITQYSPESFKFESQARSHHFLLVHWQKMMADWDAYLRGELAKKDLHSDLTEKMAGWVMPSWGHSRG